MGRVQLPVRSKLRLSFRVTHLAQPETSISGARTTVHGYETNIRAHYLPEFGDMQIELPPSVTYP
jgi:hypothetical protein